MTEVERLNFVQESRRKQKAYEESRRIPGEASRAEVELNALAVQAADETCQLGLLDVDGLVVPGEVELGVGSTVQHR